MARRLSHFCFVLTALTFIHQVNAQSDDFVRIEEDWELRVGDPDPNVAGPQVTCVISPTNDANSLHAIFNLNHQTFDDFLPGGLQLQIWHGETPVTNRIFPDYSLLSRTNEQIQWTQEMSIDDGGRLHFAIKNGTSQTWGSFGRQGHLVAAEPTELRNLNFYRPAVSITNSGVTFAANRVQHLRLVRIRVHKRSGTVTTFELNRDLGK